VAHAAEDGCTVVLASHELERARPLASREVVLTAGQAHGAIPVQGAETGQRRPRTRSQSGATKPGDRSRT
jgi:energy-coupling factor transporter ATP-binding protein EcfA2